MKRYLFLIISLALYLGLALPGIRYGLPDQGHILSYNCDETPWLESLSYLKPERRYNPYPDMKMPSGYFLMYAAGVYTASKVNAIPLHASKEYFRAHPYIFARIFLVGRLLQVCMGLLSLCALWFIAVFSYDDLAANFSVLLFAVTPGLISTSHFSQANMSVTAFVLLSLGCLLKSVTDSPHASRWIFLSAVLTGLAISMKYSAMPMVVPIFYQSLVSSNRLKNLFYAAIGLGGGVVMGIPFILMNPQAFISGLHRIHANITDAHISGVFNSLTFTLHYPLPTALGTLTLLTALIGVGRALYRKNVSSRLIIIWLIAFYIGCIRVGRIASPGRVMVSVPEWILLAGVMLANVAKEKGAFGWAARAYYVFLWAGTLLLSLCVVHVHNAIPVQKLASEWIELHIPTTQSVGLPRSAFYWTPDMIYTSAYNPDRQAHPYKVTVLNYSYDAARKSDYIVASSMELDYFELTPEQKIFSHWLETSGEFKRVAYFENKPSFGPFVWHHPTVQYLIDDDLWAPSLSIYERTH